MPLGKLTFAFRHLIIWLKADGRLPLAVYPRIYNSGMGIVRVISPQRYEKNSPFPNNSHRIFCYLCFTTKPKQHEQRYAFYRTAIVRFIPTLGMRCSQGRNKKTATYPFLGLVVVVKNVKNGVIGHGERGFIEKKEEK
jgi:hypothetical protein